MGRVIAAVLLALASAACFAAGAALQHRTAGAPSAAKDSGLQLIARLVRHPAWLGGLVLSAVAFTLHVLALSEGDLAVVQPVIVTGIVFTVLIRAGLDHRLPHGSVLVWLILTWAGLALFLVVRPKGATGPESHGRAIVFVVVGVAAVGVAMLLARRTKIDRRRGILLACGSGILFGLVAGLLKVILAQARPGFSQVFGHWSLWTLLVVGGWAIALNQQAYQATKLAVTNPVLNIAEVLVAIAFGVAVFHESVGSGPFVVLAEVVGLLVMVVGVNRLSAVA